MIADLPPSASLPAWVLMWGLAMALFIPCKGLELWRAPSGGGWRRVAFLVAWPGMDARAFLFGKARRPNLAEWLVATGKTMFGAACYFGLARLFTHPLAVGWVGMVGISFLFHFGIFHLLSVFWRSFGVDAEPIMHWPLAATSLGDFWGKRWNLAFNELAERLVFRPCVRRLGVAGATLAAFAVSGVVHELVISVPAMGGWGLPTAYFCVQGLGTVLERSRVGRRLGLRHGWRGRGFTLLVVAAPAFFLFHPPFVQYVIVPMMQATGAL